MKVCVNSAVWLVMLIFCSCSFKASERKALSLVDEWIGQEIKFRDVVSSCGCVEVEYPEEPVRAGHKRELRVRYRAKSRGPVSQSMLVYSNAEKSPVRERIDTENYSI